MLNKIKITHITMKSQYLPRFEWKSDSQSFIVYLIFTAPYFTLMTFNSKRFMYTTYYFAKFKFTWYWQFFFFFIFIFSVSPELTYSYSDVFEITMILDWD